MFTKNISSVSGHSMTSLVDYEKQEDAAICVDLAYSLLLSVIVCS